MSRSAGYDALDLVESRGATRLRLRVRAGSQRSAILGVHDGALKVTVVAAPERGRANRAVLELLGTLLGLPPSALELASGHASADKVARVPLGPREIVERLARALPEPR